MQHRKNLKPINALAFYFLSIIFMLGACNKESIWATKEDLEVKKEGTWGLDSSDKEAILVSTVWEFANRSKKGVNLTHARLFEATLVLEKEGQEGKKLIKHPIVSKETLAGEHDKTILVAGEPIRLNISTSIAAVFLELQDKDPEFNIQGLSDIKIVLHLGKGRENAQSIRHLVAEPLSDL